MKRSTAVVALIVLAGLMWLLASRNWGSQAVAGLPTGVEVGVAKSAASQPVLTAVAGVCAILGLLVALVGKVGRWVVSGVYAVGAVAFAVVSVTQVQAGMLRWLGLGLGVLALAVSVFVAVISPRWGTTHKYERNTAGGKGDAVSDWDALSRGEDPSEE